MVKLAGWPRRTQFYSYFVLNVCRVLLYATFCQILSRDKQSLEFTSTRLFMKLFRTATPTVVIECQRNFGFLPVALQIQIRTARFLQVFTVTENSLCLLFHDNAAEQ